MKKNNSPEKNAPALFSCITFIFPADIWFSRFIIKS